MSVAIDSRNRVHRLLSFGLPTLIAGCSQGLGLLQIFLLLYPSGGGVASDFFFYTGTLAAFPSQVLVQGVLFSLYTRLWVPDDRTIRTIEIALSLASILLVAAAFSFYNTQGRSFPTMIPCALLICINFLLQNAFQLFAYRRAAYGDARFIAGATLLPSIFSCSALPFAFYSNLDVKVLVFAAATMAGSICSVGVVVYVQQGERKIMAPPSEDVQFGPTHPGPELRRDSLWFGTKAVTGYGAGVALQSVAALLPASSVTIVGILSRLVSGFSTTVTNALLPRLVNAMSSGKSAAQIYCYVVLLFTTLVNAVLMIPVVLNTGLSVGQLSLAILAVTWVGGSSASAVIQRLAIRFHSSVASWVSIVVSIAVPASLGIILAAGHLNLLAVVVGFVMLDVAAGLGTALLLREYRLSVAVVAAAAFGLSLAIGIQC